MQNFFYELTIAVIHTLLGECAEVVHVFSDME